MDTLGKRIKYLREIKKISQKELADATGISRSNISKIESDILNPTSNAIVSLASYFQISTDWLLTGSISKEIEDSSSLEEKNPSYINQTNIEFGNRLKASIKESDLTLKDVSQKLDISIESILSFISGCIPNGATLFNLSKLLGVSMEWLIAAENDPDLELEHVTEKLIKSIEVSGAKVLTAADTKCLDLFGQLEDLDKGIILGRMIEMIERKNSKKNKRGMSSNYQSGEDAAAKEMA